MENPVRKTTRYVIAHAENVRINYDAIKHIAHTWLQKKLIIPPWHTPAHLDSRDEKTMLTYVILLDSINFCFWPRRGKKTWRVQYHGKTYWRSSALEVTLKHFFETHPAKSTFEYFSQIPFREFLQILRGTGDLQFQKKRWQIVRAVSRIFVKKYNGDPRKFLKKVTRKISRLVPLIVKELPSFNDAALYRGKKVYPPIFSPPSIANQSMYHNRQKTTKKISHPKDRRVYLFKRAQILVADIYGALRGRKDAAFTDLNYLTMFADYRLPQLMHYLRILEYSPHLEKKIIHGELIPAGSPEEIEIRSATIQAGEKLLQLLARGDKKLLPHELDWVLWNRSQHIRMQFPHHRTETYFY